MFTCPIWNPREDSTINDLFILIDFNWLIITTLSTVDFHMKMVPLLWFITNWECSFYVFIKYAEFLCILGCVFVQKKKINPVSKSGGKQCCNVKLLLQQSEWTTEHSVVPPLACGLILGQKPPVMRNYSERLMQLETETQSNVRFIFSVHTCCNCLQNNMEFVKF